MKPSDNINTLPTYAKDTPVPSEQRPTADDIAKGVEPLDPLPAQWWNYYWNEITSHYSDVAAYIQSLGGEIFNLLNAAGLSPSSSSSEDQILNAVRFLCRVIGTTDVPGAVTSSTTPGQVSIDPSTGKMTANNMGNTNDLITELKSSLVDAINELVTKMGQQKTELINTINEKQLRIRIGAPANPQPGDIWLEES